MKLSRMKSAEFFNNILFIIYRLILDWSYFHVIHRTYEYYGFADNRSIVSLLVSWGVFLAFLPVMRRIMQSDDCYISSFISTFFFVVSFIPFTSCIYAGLFPAKYIIFNTVFWIELFLLQAIMLKKPLKSPGIFLWNGKCIGDSLAKIIGVISFLIVFYISARYTHFRLNFNMYGVYDLRREALTYNMPTIISYAFHWTKAINPIMLAYSIEKKKKGSVILYFAIQMLSFGIDGLKLTFFMPFVIIASIKFSHRIVGKVKQLLIIGVSAIALLGMLETLLLKTYFTIEIITRRVMFIPNILSYYYYDFFLTHEPDYFRSSFLRHLGFESPYTESIGYLIGNTYMPVRMNCNDGLIADALTNFGPFGIIILPIILTAVFRLFDQSASGLKTCMVLAVALYFGYVFISSFLMTILVTHGLIAVIILLFTMKRTKD